MANTPEIDPIRIEYETLKAFIEDSSWDINPDGHKDPVRTKLVEITKEYETHIRIGHEGQRADAHTKSTKDILMLALVGFDEEKYSEALKKYGYGSLSLLSTLLYDFLAVIGGKTGQKHLQMRYRQITGS